MELDLLNSKREKNHLSCKLVFEAFKIYNHYSVNRNKALVYIRISIYYIYYTIDDTQLYR